MSVMASKRGTGGGVRQEHQDHVPARQKAAALRQEQAAAQRRRRQWLIGGVVAAVIAVAVAIGIAVQHHRAASTAALGTGPFAAPSGAVGEGSLAIPYGASAAKTVLTIYEDFRCPYCKLAESTLESVYRPFATAGTVRVQYHLVNLIDRNLGGTGSIRAGNAGACAQSAGKFPAYHDVLYANQPDENDDAFGSNAKLISLAGQVSGLDTAAFRACVNADTYGSWVTKNYDALNSLLGGSVATPYYAVNGVQFKLTAQSAAAQQAALKSALRAAVAAG
jgi:protein-disulfide isomerase